jgi:hypothetical protein
VSIWSTAGGDYGMTSMESDRDIDSEPPATAEDWLRIDPEDRHPEGGFEPAARWSACSDPPEASCSDAGCPVHGDSEPIWEPADLGLDES